LTHDLNCNELIDFAHLILNVIRDIPVAQDNIAESVAMLMTVVVHFWRFCT